MVPNLTPFVVDIEDIDGYRGYYMAARENEFYLWVLKVSLTSERSERVRDTFSSYPQAAMECSVYFIDTDEIPT